MSTLASLVEAWDEGHREFAIAISGIGDQDLWKRPDPRLLSVGELAGHVAYWQGVWIAGGGNASPNLAELMIQSPLLHDGFRYYTSSVEQPITLSLTADEVLQEVMRVHESAKGFLFDKSVDEPYPGQWRTWGNLVQYQAFHVAYHTGQVYSVRHLLGHHTEDN